MSSSERAETDERPSSADPTNRPALPTLGVATSADQSALGITAPTDKAGAHRRIVRDVAATFVVFATAGAVAGTWFSRIPAVRDQLHADLRTLGFVMLCFAIGSLLCMPFTGRLTQRFSTRTVCMLAAIGGCICVPVLALLTNTLVFAGVLLLAGACWGMWSVTLNVHGAAVEARFGRSLMPMFYGALSAGIILGSTGGALFAGHGLGLAVHFWAVVPPLLVIVLVAVPFWNSRDETDLTDAAADTDTPASDPVAMRPAAAAFQRRARTLTPQVLRIGLIAFCSALSAGATSDWLAIHAHDDKGLTEASAAAVFTVLSVAQMIALFTGGRVIDRIGRVRALRICGLIAAAGVTATIILPGPAVFLGAVLWGIGLSVVEPITLTAAGDIGGDNAPRTIAAVSTMSWSASLLGAPMIGLLAQQFSLGAALWALVGAALTVTALAGAAASSRRSAAPAGRSQKPSTLQ